jgi:hypothetical protein
MADLSPLLGEERKSDFGAVRSVDDLGCVKTQKFKARAPKTVLNEKLLLSRLVAFAFSHSLDLKQTLSFPSQALTRTQRLVLRLKGVPFGWRPVT